jgi:hypothetical protein
MYRERNGREIRRKIGLTLHEMRGLKLWSIFTGSLQGALREGDLIVFVI